MREYLRKKRNYELLREAFHVISILSSNRFRRLRGEVLPKVPFYTRLKEVLEHLFTLYPHHPLFRPRKEKKVALILFLSDISFTRSLCSRLIDKALREVPRDWEVYAVGSKCRSFKLNNFKRIHFVEGVFKRKVNTEKLISLSSELFKRYVRRELDGVYVLQAELQTQEMEKAYPYEEVKEEEKKVEVTPVKFYERGKPFTYRAYELGVSGNYDISLFRFIPPVIKKKYKKELILNFEGKEEEIIEHILGLYLVFYVQFLAYEHAAVLNLVRFRTGKRIEDNLSKRIKEVQLKINKGRQEKINKELQDIVFSLLAFEEKRFKDINLRCATLEVGEEIYEGLRNEIVRRVRRLIPLCEVRYVKGLLGFRILAGKVVYDFSVDFYLNELERIIKYEL
ncbi:FoF1 ATP synthase subunit gamma [Aquifex pyrophilus]